MKGVSTGDVIYVARVPGRHRDGDDVVVPAGSRTQRRRTQEANRGCLPMVGRRTPSNHKGQKERGRNGGRPRASVAIAALRSPRTGASRAPAAGAPAIAPRTSAELHGAPPSLPPPRSPPSPQARRYCRSQPPVSLLLVVLSQLQPNAGAEKLLGISARLNSSGTGTYPAAPGGVIEKGL